MQGVYPKLRTNGYQICGLTCHIIGDSLEILQLIQDFPQIRELKIGFIRHPWFGEEHTEDSRVKLMDQLLAGKQQWLFVNSHVVGHYGFSLLGGTDIGFYNPYLKTPTVVVKYSVVAMKSADLQASVIKDLLFVHGGGPTVNSWLNSPNIPSTFLNGLPPSLPLLRLCRSRFFFN
ncbi:hypothetical protein Sjap_007770 [Stephania japonica]|uniref:Uncharacterized protein n=1 Tax=Stephania japonica TaxID=461633 RepID=A0AAP0JP55_9MAGN